jgi:replication-associated recombination protein RarA
VLAAGKTYLPDDLKKSVGYLSVSKGWEAKIAEKLAFLRKLGDYDRSGLCSRKKFFMKTAF